MENKENQKSISRRNFLKTSVVLGGVASLAAVTGKVFASSAVAQGFSTKEKFDTIIANGMVYTGEIKAPVKADIGIRNGKITAIAKLGKNCDNWVDATDRVVCPGFID
ncbi:MAG: twin-arginine translocation signal domain-containing protein, partial [Bacteroidales bacterium]|nr:twin-arginine translocation signal domain-containing protein [Bacteroidales bacterium]